MCWVCNTHFPFPQADDDRAAVKSASRREHTITTWVRGPRRHSRQLGLLPESNGPLSGCPRGRPSLGRWRLNVQPKHDTHTRTHTKIKKKKKKKPPLPPPPRNLETKTPTSTLKVKALSPGQRSHSGQQHDDGGLCRVRANFFPVTFLLLSCPLKKWSGI